MAPTKDTTRSSTPAPPLTTDEWRARAAAHRERARRWTLPYKERRSRHEKHPVHDFLFQYYMYSPGKLEAWHPDASESLEDSPEARTRFSSPHYSAARGVIRRDPGALTDHERARLGEVVHVLSATQRRAPNFGCYGVHEWAMVYGGRDVRHAEIAPLRLPQSEVDHFVESRPVACSHFDAFRFFSDDAKPMNRIQLEWSTRHEMEQPGCIHANMDVYRWAYTAMPWVGSDILMRCFELAAEIRVLDMRASPYDLSELGFEAVRVETDTGRREYQRLQRHYSEQASARRAELIREVEGVLEGATS